MRKVEKPKTFKELLLKYREDLPEIFALEVRQSQKYVHWDKFKWQSKDNTYNEKCWLKIKLDRTGSLRAVPLYDKNQTAFQFSLPSYFQAALYQIDGLRSRLVDFSTQHNRREFLFDSLNFEESISSSQLEGAATTRAAALQMLQSESPPQTPDERMILNNYFLMNQVKEKKNEPLSLDLILKFHAIATQGDDKAHSGFLRDSNDVYVANYQNEVLHMPPEHTAVPVMLQQLCDFANNPDEEFIHPVVKAIILHFMIGYIHPFFDGNGRTARALFYWFVQKHNYAEFAYVSISKILKGAPSKYARAYLYSETDENDLTYFIDHQLHTILQAIDELFDYLTRRNKDFLETMMWLSDTDLIGKLNSREVILLKKAVKNPGKVFSVREVKNRFGVSDNTARKYLENLVKHKLLFKSSENNAAIYIARQDVVKLLKQG